MELNLVISQLLAESEQIVPRPAVVLDDIQKTQTRNEQLGQALSIALASRETNDAKLENILAALREDVGNTVLQDQFKQEISQRIAARVAIAGQIDRYQSMLELSMMLFWKNWGNEIGEFSIAEKGLRLLREALELTDDTESEDEESDTNEYRGEMRRVMEDIESAVPGLRTFKRVIRRYKKQQNPDQAIRRVTFKDPGNVNDNVKYLYDWERIFEEEVELMDKQVVRTWVEDLRPRAGGVTSVPATVLEENGFFIERL